MLNSRLIQELTRLEQRDIERETYDVFAPAYGSILVADGGVAQAGINGTPVKLTGFDTNGISLNTTPDHTDDSITIIQTGIYDIAGQFSFTGGANIEFHIHLRIDGAEQDEGTHRKLSGQDVGSCSFVAQKSLTAGEVLTAFVENVTGGAVSLTLVDAQLRCTRIF